MFKCSFILFLLIKSYFSKGYECEIERKLPRSKFEFGSRISFPSVSQIGLFENY